MFLHLLRAVVRGLDWLLRAEVCVPCGFPLLCAQANSLYAGLQTTFQAQLSSAWGLLSAAPRIPVAVRMETPLPPLALLRHLSSSTHTQTPRGTIPSTIDDTLC